MHRKLACSVLGEVIGKVLHTVVTRWLPTLPHVGCGAGEKMEITSKSYLLLLKGSSIRKPLIFCKGLKLKVPEPLSIDYTILGQAPESINIDIY